MEPAPKRPELMEASLGALPNTPSRIPCRAGVNKQRPQGIRKSAGKPTRINPQATRPVELEVETPSLAGNPINSSVDKNLGSYTFIVPMPAELEADHSIICGRAAASECLLKTLKAPVYPSEPVKLTINANLVALVLLSALSLALFCFGCIDQTTVVTMALTSWLSGLGGSVIARKMIERQEELIQELSLNGESHNNRRPSIRSDRAQCEDCVDFSCHTFELVTSIFVLMAVITITGIVYVK